MTTPLPFVWPYWVLFWGVYVWVFLPEFRVIRRAGRSVSTSPLDRGSLQILMLAFCLAIFAVFACAFLVPGATLPGDLRIWFFVGVLTLVSGGLLRRHCFRVLGAYFTGAVMIQPGQRVIESGAYRWVRHPSYSAGLLIVLGIALALGNWLGVLVSFVITFLSYVYRARVEEQALLAALGDPYARFMASRKRFVPFVY